MIRPNPYDPCTISSREQRKNGMTLTHTVRSRHPVPSASSGREPVPSGSLPDFTTQLSSHTDLFVSHSAALFGAAAAGLGTLPAMAVIVFLALLGTGIADIGTKAAHPLGELRTPGHEGRGDPADVGAIPIQPDTASHLRYVILAKTGSGAMFANHRTLITGLDTIPVLIMTHGNPPKHEYLISLCRKTESPSTEVGR